MREHVILEVYTDPFERQTLCLVDRDSEGHTKGKLAPLEVEGAHGLVQLDTADEYFFACARPVKHSRFDRVLKQFGHNHPGAVGDPLGDVPERNRTNHIR